MKQQNFYFAIAFIAWIVLAYIGISAKPNSSYQNIDEYEIRDCISGSWCK